MALLLRRFVAPTSRMLVRAASSAPAPAGGLGVTGRIPDESEQATGVEKAELQELLKGVNDPFGTEGVKVGAFGTKSAPREIPSHFSSRIVGCCCEEDSEAIHWIHVKSGEPQTCGCPRRQWFKLVPAKGDVSH
eukprot:m.35609 g.35609  ORF g.35609 m.35609 type:complete len:134 (-) comp11305_c0_seq1:484-885(-)